MTPVQRSGVVAFIAAQAALTAYAQRDLGTRSAAELRGPKLLWRLLTFNTLGTLAYVLIGRRPA